MLTISKAANFVWNYTDCHYISNTDLNIEIEKYSE